MRREPRRHLPVPLPVEIQEPDGTWVVEYAVNLSASGLCLHLRSPLRLGATVHVAFELPGSGRKIETLARVIWVSRETGDGGTHFGEMGLALEWLSEEEQHTVHHYASHDGY
jgi:hypothetical protein